MKGPHFDFSNLDKISKLFELRPHEGFQPRKCVQYQFIQIKLEVQIIEVHGIFLQRVFDHCV